MNKNTVLSNINNLIFGIVVFISALIPSFFLTITYEYFEFNKLYLFAVATIILTLLWCAKMLVEKKVYATRSTIDFAILLVLVGVVLSTITSLNKTSSLFGSYGRWFPSLFGITALFLYYYTVATNIDTAKKIRVILYTIAAGPAIPSLLGIFNYFGLTIPFMKLFNQKGFLLSGSSLNLATVTFIGVVVASLLILNLKTFGKKTAMSVIFFVEMLALIIFGGVTYVAFALVIMIFAFLKSPSENMEKSKAHFLPLFGSILAFSVMFFVIPQTKSVLQKAYPKEILPSVTESWVISSTTLRDFPIFGSGVDTFYLNYPRYRTLSQNYTSTWNTNFDKPVTEIFNILSTMGIFGLIAYGVFFAGVLGICLKSIKVNDAYKGLSITLSAGVVAGLASMILTYSSFQSMFITITLLALLIAEATINSNKTWAKITGLSLESKTSKVEGSIVESQVMYRKEVLQYIIALPIVALSAFGMYQIYLQYVPEVYIRKALNVATTQSITMAYDYQVKAISINSQRSQYHRLYANTNLALAQSLAQKPDLTDQEKTATQNLLAQSLRNIKYATETLDPLDYTNWETRARIYRFIMPAAKDADQFAIQAYNTAIQLSPTSPSLRLELGGIYFSKEDYLSAGSLFKQAVNLKKDYANARYNLAHSLIKLKAYEDAKTELEAAKALVLEDSTDYKLVENDLKMVNSLIAQLATGTQSASKPSVETIENSGAPAEAQEVTPQEPLTKPGQEPAVAPVL